MATRLATQLVLAALNMALITRGPKVRSTIKTGDCKVDSIDRCNTIFVDLSGPHRGLTPVLDESLPSPEAHDSAPPVFDKCRRPNLYKHSAVLGLVHYEPALRAGAASGILTRTALGTLPKAGRLQGMVLLIPPGNAMC
jgi:hypothetical protein